MTWFFLVITAAALAFACGVRYSDWINRGAIEFQAAEIVALKRRLRAETARLEDELRGMYIAQDALRRLWFNAKLSEIRSRVGR